MIFFKTPILKMIRNQLRKERMERSSHTTRFMNISLKDSQTKYNLMRAFAGESQARNRYTFASELAHQKKLPLLEQLFKFTADQEKAHAKVVYDFLNDCTGEHILLKGSDTIFDVSVADNLAIIRYKEGDTVTFEYTEGENDVNTVVTINGETLSITTQPEEDNNMTTQEPQV